MTTNRLLNTTRRIPVLALALALAFGIIAASSLLLVGCTGGGATDSGGDSAGSPETPAIQQSELRWGISAEIDSLDPYLAVGGDTRGILWNVFEGLLKPDRTGDLKPALAKDVETQQDGKVYVLHLREDVKFHNGNKVTPADVRYSFDQALKGGAVYAGFEQVDTVDVAEDGTITITLKEANTEFLVSLTNPIIPADYTEQASSPVGTGPFKFASYTPQQELVLEANPDYWQDGLPHLTKLTVVFAADDNATVTSLKSGNIDGAGIAASNAVDLDLGQYNIVERNSNAVQQLSLNNSYAPLADVRVRQALNYAVNADEIIEKAFFGYGTPVGTPVIPGLSKYYNSSLEKAYAADVEKATQLLAEAGYPNGFELEIAVPSNYQVHVDTAQVIVEQLKAVGINATIRQMDWPTWLEDVYTNRNYQATVVSVGGASLSPGAELARFRSDAEDNFYNFASPAFDALYDEAAATTDDAAKIKLYKEAQQIISDEAASVFIQDIAGLSALQKDFDGLVDYPLYGVTDFSLFKKAS
ncbi:MAG: ABC transporter substrate-binding protein [Coriobacteriales bacterium]|jgi:peptide/nickel transport system substrate-binding protein|nr:ABC transporter substrate-binding protein [Coriobacteriales bacterium]